MAGLLIYGSCVSRDAYAQPQPGIDLLGYVARQSLISAFLGEPAQGVDTSILTSAFQRRMVEGDLLGDLGSKIGALREDIDVIMWDIIDERMGVIHAEPDCYITPLEEFHRLGETNLRVKKRIRFGTDEHFDLFTQAAAIFGERLDGMDLMDSVVVLSTPQTSVLDQGQPDLPDDKSQSLSVQAAEWNSKASRYYDILEWLGFRVVRLADSDATIDGRHQWGVAPFHYSEATYAVMRDIISTRIHELGERSPSRDLGQGDWSGTSLSAYTENLPGLWPNGLRLSDSNGILAVSLPNGYDLVLKRCEMPDWVAVYDNDAATTTLWVRSLIYLPLLEQHGERGMVSAILDSYSKFLRASVGHPEFFRTESLDHTLALNIQSLCHLRMQRKEAGVPIELVGSSMSLLVALLERLARSDKVFKRNNHGMFLCVALLNARFVWPEVDRYRPDASADEARLRDLLEGSFSHEGVTIENTPQYQEVWIYLIAQARYLSEQLNHTDLASYLRWLHARVESAFRVMLLPTGKIPPLGDGRQTMPRELTPQGGTLFSPSVGVYVRHEAQNYFSIKCGSSSPVHKHLDDTSVYLMIGGVELIGDAGFANYDSFDRQSALSRGQLGHSSVAFRELDQVPQSFIYPASGAVGADARLHCTERNGETLITADVSLVGRFLARREVSFESLARIVVRDCAQSRAGGGGGPVQRFLVPRDAEISIVDGEILVARMGVWMRMRFEVPIARDEIRVTEAAGSAYDVIERDISSDGRVHTVVISTSLKVEK